jgi:hypothetical protein
LSLSAVVKSRCAIVVNVVPAAGPVFCSVAGHVHVVDVVAVPNFIALPPDAVESVYASVEELSSGSIEIENVAAFEIAKMATPIIANTAIKT